MFVKFVFNYPVVVVSKAYTNTHIYAMYILPLFSSLSLIVLIQSLDKLNYSFILLLVHLAFKNKFVYIFNIYIFL